MTHNSLGVNVSNLITDLIIVNSNRKLIVKSIYIANKTNNIETISIRITNKLDITPNSYYLIKDATLTENSVLNPISGDIILDKNSKIELITQNLTPDIDVFISYNELKIFKKFEIV